MCADFLDCFVESNCGGISEGAEFYVSHVTLTLYGVVLCGTTLPYVCEGQKQGRVNNSHCLTHEDGGHVGSAW